MRGMMMNLEIPKTPNSRKSRILVSEGKDGVNAVLTPPFSIEYESDVEDRAPNIFQRIFSLFTNVRSGSDLTRFQASLLLFRCSSGETPLDRFIAVVGWSISTTRPAVFGVAPYNPILGETHHVSRGTLNVFLEQVSHHPPVSALHATDEKEIVEMIWCQQPAPTFSGASVEVVVHGKRQLKLLNHGENYVMNSPNLLIRLFPRPGVDWVGTVSIGCEESGLEAELYYKGPSFLGFKGNQRSVKGKIFESKTLKTIYEVEGHWDRTVILKDVHNRKASTVIYNAKDVFSKLIKTPVVKDPKGLWATESAVVWGELSERILGKDWDKAREAKRAVEEKERELQRERRSNGETWVPKHFTVSYTKERGWECSPKQKWVPPAPIVAPFRDI
ncbi:hypothetical protein GIB67_014166 [Kingdonia uniflora]|uniref:Oxysterol-binding protein n=1 Tax=Kingdonia uniflora TaxID=39325 RepID=A0A7J7MH50_9MAGN|nr:hypothetical protein GIB67_014166 [Kingdonia uniflora]